LCSRVRERERATQAIAAWRVRPMKRGTVIRTIGFVVSMICLGYFAIKAAEAWEISGIRLTPAAVVERLATASIPLLLTYATSALAWVAVMRGLGVRVSPTTGAGIYLAAQFAKYLPGNVGHLVGRVVLSLRHGYPGATVAFSMMVELALLIVGAVLLSLPLLDSAWEKYSAVRLLVLVFGAGALVAGVLLLAARNVTGLRSYAPAWVADLWRAVGRAPTLPWLMLAASLLAFGIVLSGLSLLLLEGSAAQPRLSDVAGVVSVFSLAWVAGLLTPGAPAGLGVREAILIEGLSPLMGASEAASCAVLFRLLTTLTDATAFAAGLALLKLAGPPIARPAHDAQRITVLDRGRG
jgi:hypothetical protein